VILAALSNARLEETEKAKEIAHEQTFQTTWGDSNDIMTSIREISLRTEGKEGCDEKNVLKKACDTIQSATGGKLAKASLRSHAGIKFNT
jgi:hypothetical protein